MLDLNYHKVQHIEAKKWAFEQVAMPASGPLSHNKGKDGKVGLWVDTILNTGLIEPFTISRMNLSA